MIVIGCKVIHFINDEDQEALSYNTLRRTNVIASHRIYEFWAMARLGRVGKIRSGAESGI